MPANVPTTRVAGADPDATLLVPRPSNRGESPVDGCFRGTDDRACQAIASDGACGRCRHRGHRPVALAATWWSWPRGNEGQPA